MLNTNKIHRLYRELLEKHGPPEKIWPQWCAKKKSWRDRELIAIGAILTQRTSWHNANLALKNLKKASLLSIEKIARLRDLKRLTKLIRPAGFYQVKPKRLYDLCRFIVREYGGLKKFMKEDLAIAREKLLDIHGIGPETADTILLYVCDQSIFVVDEYTKRLVRGRRLAKKLSYDYLQDLFEKNLPRNFKIYQDFHALIIIGQKGREASRMEKI